MAPSPRAGFVGSSSWELWGALSGPRGKMGRDQCCTHRDGGPRKQGALLARGEGSDAISSARKSRISSVDRPLCPVCGVTVLVIKKPFVNRIFSSHSLCNAARLPCCNCTQVPAPNSPRHLFLDCGDMSTLPAKSLSSVSNVI